MQAVAYGEDLLEGKKRWGDSIIYQDLCCLGFREQHNRIGIRSK